jgi:DNA gyrase subunit B
VFDVATIRRRPAMFVGDLDETGIQTCVFELVANAVDQFVAGHCTTIAVDLHQDGSVSVTDDGAGFDMEPRDGMTLLERAFTSYHDTPTLDGHAGHLHIGTCLGVFPLSALAAWVEVETRSGERMYAQRFERGFTASPLRSLDGGFARGTRVHFLPDEQIFGTAQVGAANVARRLSDLARLLAGLTLTFRDHRTHRFHAPDGIADFVGGRAFERSLGPAFVCRFVEDDISVETAARYLPFRDGRIESFTNAERTTSGTHVTGFVAGLCDGAQEIFGEGARSLPSRAREGALRHDLHAFVCVRLADVTYGKPNRDELKTPRVEGIVRRRIARDFAAHLRENHALRGELAARVARIPREGTD